MNAPATPSASRAAPTTTPLAPAIECSRVHQVFRTRKETVHAVNDVSLRIDRGEIVAGRRGDLIQVHQAGGGATVRAVWCGGQRVA